MKRLTTSLAIVAGAGLLATAAQAAPAAPATATHVTYPGAEFAKMAKITLAQAKARALKVRPGKITDTSMEKHPGGSGLRYAFDVLSHGKVWDVSIDANTGAVLLNAPEGKVPD